MITCPKCGKENQDHYKFCLGCGSELPRDVASPQRSFSTPTPPAGIPVAQSPADGGGFGESPPAAFPAGIPAPAAEPPSAAPPMAEPPSADPSSAEPPSIDMGGAEGSAEMPPAPSTDASAPAVADEQDEEPTLAPMGAMVTCTNCGAQNPSNFKFCGACGAKIEAPADAEPAPVAVAPVDGSVASLVLIRPDGSEGGTYGLNDGSTTVGRSTGQIFSADAYLSPDHATFSLQSGRMTVRDEASLNGVYVRIPAEQPMSISSGDVVRMGQELVRIEILPDGEADDEGTEAMGSATEDVWGRVSLIVGDGQLANAFLLTGEGTVLGRERGDVLFPEDGYVSGTHVRVQRQGDSVQITDLNSSNGTFLRVSDEQELNQGDYILMGQQLFRVDF